MDNIEILVRTSPGNPYGADHRVAYQDGEPTVKGGKTAITKLHTDEAVADNYLAKISRGRLE